MSNLGRGYAFVLHIAAALISLGYSASHWFSGTNTIAVLAFGSAMVCVVALRQLAVNRPMVVWYAIFFLLQLLTLTLTCYFYGIRGVILLFPICCAFFYVFAFYYAIVICAVFVTVNLVAASFVMPPDLLIRVVVALVLTILLASNFSWLVERQKRALEFDANHDYLTKVYNRKGFAEWLRQDLQQRREMGHEVALFFIDLDNFKQINDHYGHDVGDKILMAFAQRITALLRADEVIIERGFVVNFARISGDEFALSIAGTNARKNAINIADRIVTALRRPFSIERHTLHITSSIGVSYAGDVGYDFDELIRNSDMAMYESKAQGRNQYHIYECEAS